MLTPKLEELILCGRAFFKTFVAGGTKHTLTFGNDRFIIITDITYFPMNIIDNNSLDNQNTQVAIYGERGYNHFIFRNYNISDTDKVVKDFINSTTIHTYLMHEQQVGFSFVNANFFSNPFVGVANTTNPGYQPPLEYGIEGQPGVSSVILTADATNGAGVIQNNFTTRPAPGLTESQQLFFPYGIGASFVDNFQNNYEYPLLHVNYVEVIGSANNIQI